MSHLGAEVLKFVAGEEGATMVEYALMLALIAAACSVAVSCIGYRSNTMFGNVGASLQSVR